MEKKPAILAEMLSDDFNTAVEIREISDNRNAVFALEDISLGKKFGYFAGFITQTNGYFALHLEGKVIEGIGTLQFLGHDSKPNSGFENKDRWLYAKENIRKGDEIKIDYMCTEKELPPRFQA